MAVPKIRTTTPSARQLQYAGYKWDETKRKWLKGDTEWAGEEIEVPGQAATEEQYIQRAQEYPDIYKWEPTAITEQKLPEQVLPTEQITAPVEAVAPTPAPVEETLPEGWSIDENNVITTNENWKIKQTAPDVITYTSPDGIEYSREQLNEIIKTDEVIADSISKIYPNNEVEDMLKWADENPEQFLNSVRDYGDTPETRALLKAMNIPDEDADLILREETEEPWYKNAWDAIYLSTVNMAHKTKNYFISAIPNLLFPAPRPPSDFWEAEDLAKHPEYMEYYEQAKIQNQQQRDKYRAMYVKSEAEHKEWLEKHPELQPPSAYMVDITEHPEVVKDPGFWAYAIADALPFTVSVLGTTLGVSALTRNPYVGIAAGTAIATPAQSQDLYEDLINSGAPEDKASQLTVPFGGLIASIEAVTDLPLLKAISPAFNLLKGNIKKAIIDNTMSSLVKKGVGTFTKIETAEVLEEVSQSAIQNAIVKTFDENRQIFEDIDETVIRTLIATSPFAIFGGASAMRHVPTQESKTVSPEDKEAQGWEQDKITGEWYKPETITDTVQANIDKFRESGMSTEQAREKAYNEAARTPEGEQAIREAADKIRRGEPLPEAAEQAVPTGMPEGGAGVFTTYQGDIVNIGELVNFGAFGDRGLLVGGTAKEALVRPIKTKEGKLIGFKDPVNVKDTVRKIHEPAPLSSEEMKVLESAKVTGAPGVATVAKQGQIAPFPPEGAVRRVFNRISMEPDKVSLSQKIRQGLDKAQIRFIDDLFPIKKFVNEFTRGGVKLSVQENPYILARLLQGISSKATVFIEKGTFGKTFWKVDKKGHAQPNFTGESLEFILQEVKDPKTFQDFTTYLVSRRSVQLAQRNIDTGVDVADAEASISQLESQYSNFPDLAKRLYEYQDRLLNYGYESGLFSKELMDKLQKFGDYVPFYRVFDELASKGFMGKKMANIAQPLKRIKGSERQIINPIESIIKNTYTIISAADRNQVGIAMANLVDKNPELADMFERVKTPIARVAGVTAKELGIEIENLTDDEVNQVIDVFRPSMFVQGDEVTVLVEGKKHYYKVDPDLKDSLLHLDQESMGILGRLLSLPAKWLRAGATLSPDFMVRNPMRDQMTAFAYSEHGFLPGIDFLRGLASLLGKDADYQLFKMSGAEHSMLVSLDREYLQKTFKEVVRGKGFTNYVKHPLELFQIVSELGEKATRLGEFKRGIGRGATPLEAGYAGRNVTLDFSQSGTSTRAINQIIAFFNANIRGWTKMISSFKEHPVRTSSKVFMGITVPSILLYLANRDDDRWKEIPQWQKDLFWIVMTDEHIYRIPKPFELGIIFGSFPERFLEWLDNKDPELLKEALVNMSEAGLPGFIPTAAVPIIEWMTNYSFFKGQPLVPQSRQGMPPELQYTRWTSEVSKKLGELLKLSPAKIDNLINGWTGGLGRYATDVLGGILKGTGISPDIPEPSPELADIPVIKAFIIRNPYGSSGVSVNKFYDKLEEYEAGEKYLKEMLELGEQDKFEKYKAEHPELLFFYDFEKGTSYSASARYLRKVGRQMTELRKKEDEIYDSKTMSPEEKRQKIDEIEKLKTEISRKALDLFLGGEPKVIQEQLIEFENKLGEVLEDTPALSTEKPDIYNMRDLSSDYAITLESMTEQDIQSMQGIPETAKSWVKKEQLDKIQRGKINVTVYNINADSSKGDTFEDYYKQWQERQKITDPVQLAEFDKKYDKAYLGNLTKRQIELLKEYHGLSESEKRKFVEEHPEIAINPRDEWLKSNPKDNAVLAIWGEAKILSLEAYKEAKRLIEELDIPDSALSDFHLPPENLVENDFTYADIVDKYGGNSSEAKLYLIEHNEYQTWRIKEGLTSHPLEDNPNVLKLNIKWRDLDDQYEGISQAKSEFYVEGEGAQERARLKLLSSNPEYRDDRRRRDAYGIEGFPESQVETYVDWYRTKRAGYEDDWYLLEHKEFYDAMVKTGQMSERDFSKVPTKAVYNLYTQYENIQGEDKAARRLEFRRQHPELDAWMLLTGKVSKLATEQPKKTTTPKKSTTTPTQPRMNIKEIMEGIQERTGMQ